MQLIRYHFTTINSTNSWAKQQAHLFPREMMTLVTADEQTEGRGRFKRHWHAPSKTNLLASFCFFIKGDRKDIGNVSQIMGLSAIHTLEKLGVHAALKWPNDILLSRKKVAGILVETTPIADHICVIAGIGLNINMPLKELQRIDQPATSLFLETGHPFDIETTLQNLHRHFNADLSLFLAKGFDPFLEEYARCIFSSPSTPIRFHDQNTIWEGTFDSINRDGSYNLKLQDGTIKTFYSGELQVP